MRYRSPGSGSTLSLAFQARLPEPVANLRVARRFQLRDSVGISPNFPAFAIFILPFLSMGIADSIVLLNTGNGKGKSSAAFGVMSRGWARGWRVVVVQFIKSGKYKTGEKKLGEHLGIEWHTLGDGFTWESTDLDETAAKGKHAFNVASELLASANYDLVILDELTYAISYGWVSEQEVTDAIKNRSSKTNVVITGRNATQGLIDVCDTVTEMRKIKHAYDTGIRAKKGIEY